MTRLEMDTAAVQKACLGNQEAMDFLKLWSRYVHAIDDIIDGEIKDAEGILKTFAMPITLYSHPFYLRNLERLSQIALNCTNAYCDSVTWEKSDQEWQRGFADHYRHFGQEMVLAVASICAYPASYEHLRAISLEWRTMSWMEHHHMDGTPT